MSLHPARDEADARKKREAIELCGKNRGPHDYVPIEWRSDPEAQPERVTRFLCRVCFCNVNTSTLIANYANVSQTESHDIF